MYILRFTPSFASTYTALIKKNTILEKRTEKSLRLLKNDPFHSSLRTHKVNTRSFGKKWSSWITGDLRIIWDFDEDAKQVVLLLAIAKHSGSYRQYK